LSSSDLQRVTAVVYVDSGSTDDSLSAAAGLGADCVELDMSIPFTAARARNAGFERLLQRRAGIRFVQFVDGDCELVDGWLEVGARSLDRNPQDAAVCGRLTERFPEASLYNKLCDMGWNGPIGEIEACGGNAMHRAEAFREVGGFSPGLIAGEEGDLCLRLRRADWKIRRVDAEMVLHDSNMMRFSQWWTRSVRVGFGYAEGAHRLGGGPERYKVRETRRIWFWGLALPAVALGAMVPTFGLSLGLLGAYPVSMARLYTRTRKKGYGRGDAMSQSVFTTLGKLPELQGAVQFHLKRLTGRRQGLIEYRANS
jgi:GT2 family glycosyltransferase